MGHKIQYSAPLRRVAKDQDCSAPYVGVDFRVSEGHKSHFKSKYSIALR